MSVNGLVYTDVYTHAQTYVTCIHIVQAGCPDREGSERMSSGCCPIFLCPSFSPWSALSRTLRACAQICKNVISWHETTGRLLIQPMAMFEHALTQRCMVAVAVAVAVVLLLLVVVVVVVVAAAAVVVVVVGVGALVERLTVVEPFLEESCQRHPREQSGPRPSNRCACLRAKFGLCVGIFGVVIRTHHAAVV